MQRQPVQRLQDQHPEFQNHIEAGTAAFRGIASAQGLGQHRPDNLEIHHQGEFSSGSPLSREFRKTTIEIPKSGLTRHPSHPLMLRPWKH